MIRYVFVSIFVLIQKSLTYGFCGNGTKVIVWAALLAASPGVQYDL